MTQQSTNVLAFDDRDGHIPCPTCGSRFTTVKDSRGTTAYDLAMIRRRRFCPACSARFSTFELSAEVLDRVMRIQNAKMQLAMRIVEMIDNEVRGEIIKRITGGDAT